MKYLLIILSVVLGYFGLSFFQSTISEPIQVEKKSGIINSVPASLGINFNTTVTALVLPPDAQIKTFAVVGGQKLSSEKITSLYASGKITKEVAEKLKADEYLDFGDQITKQKIFDYGVATINWPEVTTSTITPQQRKTAQDLIDSGVSVVIGQTSGPLQETERYKSGLIVYSLGQFLTQKGDSVELKRAAILKMSFITGMGIDFSLIPTNTFSEVVKTGN